MTYQCRKLISGKLQLSPGGDEFKDEVKIVDCQNKKSQVSILTVATTVIGNHTIEMEPNLRHAAPPPPPARSQAANKQQIIVTKQD